MYGQTSPHTRRGTERDRQTDRQTDRETKTQKQSQIEGQNIHLYADTHTRSNPASHFLTPQKSNRQHVFFQVQLFITITVSLCMCHIMRKITLHIINSLVHWIRVNYTNLMGYKLWLLAVISTHGNLNH